MNRPRVVVRAWPLAAALLLLVASLTALGFAMMRATGGELVYPLDDTYIQMAIAKTLASHGTWGVTRYEFSGAGSSLLWPVLLAGLDRVTGLGARLPLIVNVLASALVTALAAVAFGRHVASRTGQASALAAVIVGTSLPALALIGMEHTLQCAGALALTLAGVSLCEAPPDRDRQLVPLVALLGAFALSVRYDTASIVVALMILVTMRRGWRYAVPLAIGSALPVAAYALMAWRHGWPALPAPVLLKQRLWGASPLSWHGAADLLGGGALTVLVNTPALLVLVIVAAALLAAPPRERESPAARESQALLLVFLIATGIHLQFGRVGWLYRYEAYLVVLGIVSNAAALARQVPARWPRFDASRVLAAVTLAAVMVHPLLLRAFLASRDVVTSAADLYRHEYVWSHFFQQYPPDGGLLVGDLGAVAYFTDAPIVDAGGLGTLEMLPSHWLDPIDIPRAVRAAQSRGVRVSLIDGPIGGPATGWSCVAAWTTVSDLTPTATFWLSAADAEAAAHLARDLRAFSAQHPDGFSLRFADAQGRCP